jgi:hypothetical protein
LSAPHARALEKAARRGAVAQDRPDLHWDAIFPGAVEELRRNIKGLGEIAQRKILGDNARRFMNLPG